MIDLKAIQLISSLKLRNEPIAAEVPYCDPLDYFLSVGGEREGDILLDGADDTNGKGRYSVAARDPLFILRVKNGLATLKSGDDVVEFKSSPLEIIELLEKTTIANAKQIDGLPGKAFNGGLIFLLSYEMNRYYEKLPPPPTAGFDTDDLWCAFYPRVRIFDAVSRTACDIEHCDKPETAASPSDREYSLSKFECDESMADYIEKIEKIKRYIEEGDVYQANLSRRLIAEFRGSAPGLYAALRNFNPASYGAFINGGDFNLLSLSPETFFTVRDDMIETRPIKGTAPRSADASIDERNRESLKISEKDQAENIMIVDLMRNDLSRICRVNSVRVPSLLECESLPTVHHLVSTVTGELKSGTGLSGILKACYPGGSVTGAPKIRAMEIIAELETTARGHYCGSIIACGLNGSITASLLIRTLTVKNGKAVYRTGGGITACSDAANEFEETRHKAAMLEKVFGDMLIHA